jgi:hypothetical protein
LSGRDSHTFSDPNTGQKIMRTLWDPNEIYLKLCEITNEEGKKRTKAEARMQ